jgi:hypothetical protein
LYHFGRYPSAAQWRARRGRRYGASPHGLIVVHRGRSPCIGDVLIYLVRLADELGIDPLEAANQKLEKNQRKYPADKAKGKALKCDEYPDG